AASARTTGAAANRPSRTPTAHAAWPSRSAASGAAMRMPAMHEWSAIWPPISASSALLNSLLGRSVIRVVVGIGVVDPRSRQERLHAQLGRRLDALQGARHLARSRLRLADRVDDRVRLPLDVGEDVAELAELGLDHAQHLAHLVRALLERQRVEAELQTGQDCPQ